MFFCSSVEKKNHKLKPQPQRKHPTSHISGSPHRGRTRPSEDWLNVNLCRSEGSAVPCATEVRCPNGQRGSFTIMKNKETWKLIIQTVISILSAIATTLGLNSCLWVMSLNRKCRNPLTTQSSKICGHLSHRRHLRANIEWWVSWQLTLKTQKPTQIGGFCLF